MLIQRRLLTGGADKTRRQLPPACVPFEFLSTKNCKLAHYNHSYSWVVHNITVVGPVPTYIIFPLPSVLLAWHCSPGRLVSLHLSCAHTPYHAAELHTSIKSKKDPQVSAMRLPQLRPRFIIELSYSRWINRGRIMNWAKVQINVKNLTTLRDCSAYKFQCLLTNASLLETTWLS